MSDDLRGQKLLHAYDQERQDERAYWSTVATVMLTALTALLTVTLIAKSVPWEVWIAVPVPAFAVGAYIVQQSAIGARRRRYMEALELELSQNEQALTVEGINVRLFANNRYTWSLARRSTAEAAGRLAPAIFLANVAAPAILMTGTVGISIYRIVESGHLWSAGIVAFIAVSLLGLLMTSMVSLTKPRSREKSWNLAPCTPRPLDVKTHMNKPPHDELAELLDDEPVSLATEELNNRLQAIWPLLRGGQLHCYDQPALIALFRHAGYVSDAAALPEGNIVIYRGEPAIADVRGISWSLNLSVATTYARRNTTADGAFIWQASAPAAAVLAQFAQDGEVLVDLHNWPRRTF